MNRSDALIAILAVFLIGGIVFAAAVLAIAVPVTLRYGYAAGMAVLGSILAALAGSAVVLCALA